MPPCWTLKNEAPTWRSSSTIESTPARNGEASTTRPWVTSVAHTNSGSRVQVMPGARMLWMVTRKLMPPSIEATPRRCSPMIQRSWPTCGEYAFSVSGT